GPALIVGASLVSGVSRHPWRRGAGLALVTLSCVTLSLITLSRVALGLVPLTLLTLRRIGVSGLGTCCSGCSSRSTGSARGHAACAPGYAGCAGCVPGYAA